MTDDPHAAKLGALLAVLHRHKLRVRGVTLTIRSGKNILQYDVETELADAQPERIVN